jgi:hypothetical protein
LPPGGSAVCTITNDDTSGPILTVIKHVVNDSGGTAVASDWTMDITATNPSNNNFPGSEAGVEITFDAGSYSVSESGGKPGYEATFSAGCSGSLNNGETATCTITNDDEPEDSPPDPASLTVEKVLLSETYGCPAVNGGKVEFLITVENRGVETAEGVLLTDNWSSELKPVKTPDIYDCTLIKENTVRCKLGDMTAADAKHLTFEYYLNGDIDKNACNLASVTSSPAETTGTDNNEAEACFSFVGQLGTSPTELAPATDGIYYNQAIDITGGLPDKDIVVTGLPDKDDAADGAMSASIDHEQNRVTISGCPSLAEGATLPLTIDVSYFGDDQETACETFSTQYQISIENQQGCGLAEISTTSIQPRATVTGKLSRPDESLHKIVINSNVPEGQSPERFVVGHIDRKHSYATDPNGPYVDHDRNYDIRVVKYDGSGTLAWDKTYDTGNDDLGYTLTLSADGNRIFVGGMSTVETKSNWRLDAVLLEIDAVSGCTLGEHFQSAGNATTSAYYNLATDGDKLFAVGEQQGHPAKEGEFGALVSVFSQDSNLPGHDECADELIIAETSPGGEALTWQQDIIRGADPGSEEDAVTVAYTIGLPAEGCEPDCAVLVGGKSGEHGWVDTLDTETAAMTLSPFALPRDMNVQDISVRKDYIVVVGSSIADVTNILKYRSDGSESWRSADVGEVKGRLRAVEIDKNGFIYAAGTNIEDNSAGLIIMLDASGNLVDSRQIYANDLSTTSSSATGVSFQDLVVLKPDRGAITGQVENGIDSFDFEWMLLDFGCEDSCSPPN